MRTIQFALSGAQHAELRAHLFPGDGKEAVALILCGQSRNKHRDRLTARRVILIPHADVEQRSEDEITWSVEDQVLPLVEEMEKQGLGLIVAHSHPGGYSQFSGTDDVADRELFPSVHSWFDDQRHHGAAVMLPSGEIFGRVIAADGAFTRIDSVSVIGDDLRFFPLVEPAASVPEFARRVAQTFGAATYARLRMLRIAVVGVSGTGSVVAELLARNCVGALVLIDPDRLEDKNLNRILNSTAAQAQQGIFKVHGLATAIREFGLGTEVEVYATSIHDDEAASAVAGCDVVFGCVDTVEGRHVLNELCSAYCIPFFDVGVHIEPDGNGGITHAVAQAHYVQPHGSSLLSRGVYSAEELAAESWKRTDPTYYEAQRVAGYLQAVGEDRPAVMPLNMMASNMGVIDFLARLHGFRLDPNRAFATQTMNITHGFYESEADGKPCPAMSRLVGLGDRWKVR